MSIFDKVDRRVKEPEYIYCPFCNCTYVSLLEKRPLVDCPACEGSGQKAEQATMEVSDILDRLFVAPKTLETLREAQGYVSKLGSGYYRAEFFHLAKEIEQEIK